MKKSLGLAVALLSSQSLAGEFDIGLYLAQEFAKKNVAEEQGFGDSMQSGGFTLAYNTHEKGSDSLALENNPFDDYQAASGSLSILLGYGFLSAPDNEKFTVSTVDSNNDHGSRSSSVGGSTFFAELGYNHFINKDWDFFFNLGRASYDLDRSVSACSNCPEEALEFSSSSYAHTGISYGSKPKIKVGYLHHSGGDMKNNFRLQFAW